MKGASLSNRGDGSRRRRRRGARRPGSRRCGARPPGAGRQAGRGQGDGRAHHGARQGARREPQGRLPRSRRHGLLTPRATPDDQARRLPVVYLLHGYGGRDDTFTARLAPAGKQRQACRRAGLQRGNRRHAQRVHAAQGQHVFELAHDRRLGTLHRRRPRRLHRQPLPHASRSHEPRPGRSLDGWLWRAADRDEATGRVLRACTS